MIDKEFFFPRNVKIAVILPVFDFLAIFLLLALVTWGYDDSWNDQYSISGIMAGFLFLFFGNYVGLYDKFLKPPTRKHKLKLFGCWFLAVMLTLFVAFLRKNTAEHSRVILILWFVSTYFAFIFIHSFWHAAIRRMQRHSSKRLRVAIAGANSLSTAIKNKMHGDVASGVVVEGIYDDNEVAAEEVGLQYLGKFEKMLLDAHGGVFDVLFITLSIKNEETMRSLVQGLRDTTVSVYIVPDSFIFDIMHGELSSYKGMPLIEVFESPFYGVDSCIKRIEDILIGGGLFLAFFPLMVFVGILVKLTSRGPVLFSQKRYGANGEIIKILKFRSMTVCEDGKKIEQAKKGDKRITRLGHFLRKTSLDELPQFYNVLQGTLSVVGPRPHAVAHNEIYRELISGYMMRHKVKPGITGWAQVNGYRGETYELEKMQKRVEYDMYYIRKWSLWFDIEIMFKTAIVVILGKNAY